MVVKEDEGSGFKKDQDSGVRGGCRWWRYILALENESSPPDQARMSTTSQMQL